MNVQGYVKYAALLGVAAVIVFVFGLFETRPVYDSLEKALEDVDPSQLVFACTKVELTEYVNVSGNSIPSIRLVGVYDVSPLGDLELDHSKLVVIKNRTMSNLVKASYLRMQRDQSVDFEWTMGLLPLTVVAISRSGS